MQSTPTLNEADPHDVFAIETILAGRADRAPPLAHDASHHAAGPLASAAGPQAYAAGPQAYAAGPQAYAAEPQVHAAEPQVHIAPQIRPEMPLGAPAPQVDPVFRATDVRTVQLDRPDEIRLDDLKPLGERPTSKWGKRIVMALLGLCGAIAAAAWQHYGDHARAMAADWAPPFVLAALSSSRFRLPPPSKRARLRLKPRRQIRPR